jgi:hypothetical protein
MRGDYLHLQRCRIVFRERQTGVITITSESDRDRHACESSGTARLVAPPPTGELDSGPGLEVGHEAGGVGLNGAEFVVEVGST